MHTCDLGQSSHQIVHFWLNFGVGLALNGVFGWKCHVWFPPQALQTLLMNWFWLWNTSAAIYNHLHMSFGPNQPWSCSFLAQIGGQFGRKCCDWVKIPSTNSIPGCIVLVRELIMTFECFCSSLQSYPHMFWAKVAPKLFIFVKLGGQLDSKWCVWVKRPCINPIPDFANIANWPILTLECFCNSF